MLKAFLLATVTLLLSSCALPGFRPDSDTAQPESARGVIGGQTDEDSADEERSGTRLSELLTRLCLGKDEIGLSGYEGTTPRGRGGEIFLCGEHVRISSPLDLMDAPDLIFDFAGKRVGSCGGMPKPGSINAPACELECERTGLYFCAE